MPGKTSYQQLQPEERLTIASLYLQGLSMRAMARILGRSPGTISRELTRNSSPVGYASVAAAALCSARRSASRQQISGTLKRMYLFDSTQLVSHETICMAIYAQ